ncbi:MAG: hypothetical protein LBP67_00765 [Bacteroidales bacterium]|jgi:hypothetical protein|nr:hypothetical protein [Bacteroidales bacterium]
MKIETDIYKKSTKILFDFLLLIVVVLTFLPLFKVSFIAADDLENFIKSDINLWFADGLGYAKFTGRFYFLLVRWIYFLPYLINAPWFYYTMKVIPLIVGIILLFSLIKRAGYDNFLVMLGLLLFCALFQFGGAGSSVTCYPFYFSVAIVLVLSSIHLIFNYHKTGKYYYIIISSVLMAIASLFQESLLMYYVLVLIIILSKYKPKTFLKKENILKFLKEIGPFVFFGIAYIIVYFWYLNLYPSKYVGNRFSEGISFVKSLQMLMNIIVKSSPLASFFNYKLIFIPFSDSISTEYSLMFYLKNAGILAYIKSFIIVLLYLFILKLLPQNTNKKKVLFLLLISAIAVVLPQIPLVLSEKVYLSLRMDYVTLYYSFLAIIIVITSLFYLIILLSRKNKIIFVVINCIIAILLFISTLLTQYTNEVIAKDVSISQERLLILNDFKEAANLKENDVVCTQNLYFIKTIFGKSITAQKNSSIRAVLTKIYGIKINEYNDYKNFYNKFHETEDTVNIFYYSQASKSYDSYIALIKCKGNELTPDFRNIKTDNMIIGYRSTYKKFSVSIASEDNNLVKINNKNMPAFGSMYITNIYYFLQQPTVIFSINGKDLYPASLTISNIVHPHSSYIKIGKYDQKLHNAYAKYNMRMILRDKKWTENLEEKADKGNKAFEKVLQGDAEWLIYN